MTDSNIIKWLARTADSGVTIAATSGGTWYTVSIDGDECITASDPDLSKALHEAYRRKRAVLERD